MDSQYSNISFEQIVSQEGNNICNDCLQSNPRWCSVNNAVFLCSLCARKHRELPYNNSSVKSIEVNHFDEEEISLLQNGGNIRFNQLLEGYGIPLMSSAEYKYQNNASRYYRNLLLKKVNNTPLVITKPTIVQGVLLIDVNAPIFYPAEVIEILNQHKVELDSLKEGKNVFDNSLKLIGNAFIEFKDNVKSTWNEGKFKEKFNESSEEVKKWAQNSKEFIVDKSNKVVESQLLQNIKEKTSESISKIKDKARQLMNNNNNNNNSNSDYSNIPH